MTNIQTMKIPTLDPATLPLGVRGPGSRATIPPLPWNYVGLAVLFRFSGLVLQRKIEYAP